MFITSTLTRVTKENNVIMSISCGFHTSSVKFSPSDKGKDKWTEFDSVDPSDGTKSDNTEAIRRVIGDNEKDLKEYFDRKMEAVKMYYHTTRKDLNPYAAPDADEWYDNKAIENHEVFQIWQSREQLLPKEAASYYPKGHPKNPIVNSEQNPVVNSEQSASSSAKDLTVSQNNVVYTGKRERSLSPDEIAPLHKREKISSEEAQSSSQTGEGHVSQTTSQTDDDSLVSSVIDIVKDLL